ncbi:MAG: pyridoxal-phosphate dependent enzyme [Flavobacteriaceae bacterium]|nr:pyridoxal-phosphate dependent enzyme [Flavobacteriaceae bacterium]
MPIQPFRFPDLDGSFHLFIKREDLVHPIISGNKFWKMKYNLLECKKLNAETLVTFGGAMSNHIVAAAAAGKENNFKTVGIIRGQEIIDKWQDNETLCRASELGMKFRFVPRDEYRLKEKSELIRRILNEIPNHYLVPEGGTNALAVKGAAEILDERTSGFDIITTAMGTGGTLAGLSVGAHSRQRIIGFPSLKNAGFLVNEVLKYSNKENFTINLQYHFGGYAKVSEELIDFINDFYRLNDIPLDPVYTGKMMFGLREMLKNGEIGADKKILAVHTGGLQGIREMNKFLKKKHKIVLIDC